jgi:AraC family transcriptional regulator
MLRTHSAAQLQPFAGFRVEHATTPAGMLTLPLLHEHRLKIHAGTPVRGACSKHRFLYTRGDIDIQPAGYFDTWQEFQSSTSLIVHLPKPLLQYAAEDMQLDADAIQLDAQHQVRDARLEHIAWSLDADRREQQPNGSLFTESLGLALAAHLLRNYQLGTERSVCVHASRSRGLSAARLRRVREFIEEHLDEPLSIERLARVAAISASHLKSQFKRATGFPVHEYVVRQRVQRAKMLLTGSDLPLSQIALEAGFSHQSHMARAVRRVLGVRPKLLRNLPAERLAPTTP